MSGCRCSRNFPDAPAVGPGRLYPAAITGSPAAGRTWSPPPFWQCWRRCVANIVTSPMSRQSTWSRKLATLPEGCNNFGRSVSHSGTLVVLMPLKSIKTDNMLPPAVRAEKKTFLLVRAHIRIASVVALALIAGPAQKFVVAQSPAKTSISAPAQTVDSLLDQSYGAMYNLRFDEALRLAESAKSLANDDPVPWMAQACAALFREFDRMHILRSELFAADDKFIDGPAMTWDAQGRKDFDNALA